MNNTTILSFSKSFSKSLVNRYSKSLNINISPQWQVYHQQNNALHSFQNIDKQYQKFVPSADITYWNNQFGDFNEYASLSYGNSFGYPSVNQLAPLVDSSNAYSLQFGNAGLLPSRQQNIRFNFNHDVEGRKNDLSYGMNVSAGKTDNRIVDSSYYNNAGKRIGYLVNVDGYKSINAGANVRKSYKFENHQLQVRLNTNFSISKNPTYVNGELNFSNGFNNGTSLNFYYTYKDLVNINAQQGANFYRSKTANNYHFKNASLSTRFSASTNLTKKLNISSNVAYSHSTSNGANAIDFTIWNADITYRFFKSQNLETKFSALDLLHQNTSIINYGSNNTLTRGVRNVLQHYFMLTVSYFPRQFGKKEKK